MAITKLKSGKWQAIVSYRDTDGVSRKKKQSFSTRREAKAYESDFTLNPQVLQTKEISYKDILDAYLKWNSSNASQRTINDKKNMAQKFWSHWFERPFDTIIAQDYLEVWTSLVDHGYSTERLNKYIILLKSIGAFAERFYEFKNYSITIDTLRKKRGEGRSAIALSIEELYLFLSHVDDVIMRKLFSFLYFTGLRIGEARALLKSDIVDGKIDINKSIRSFKEGFKDLKTDSSYRIIRLNDMTIESIKPLIEMPGDFLFGGEEPFSMRSINASRESAIKSSGLPYFVNHDFRHSFGSYLLSQHVNLKAVSVYMGHASTETTARTYEHLLAKSEDHLLLTLNEVKVPQKYHNKLNL